MRNEACNEQSKAVYTGAEDVRPTLGEPLDNGTNAEAECSFAPALQLLTSACWLSLKEAGLVIGIIARHIPLLGSLLWTFRNSLNV